MEMTKDYRLSIADATQENDGATLVVAAGSLNLIAYAVKDVALDSEKEYAVELFETTGVDGDNARRIFSTQGLDGDTAKGALKRKISVERKANKPADSDSIDGE
jgi:hypothetical protein